MKKSKTYLNKIRPIAMITLWIKGKSFGTFKCISKNIKVFIAINDINIAIKSLTLGHRRNLRIDRNLELLVQLGSIQIDAGSHLLGELFAVQFWIRTAHQSDTDRDK